VIFSWHGIGHLLAGSIGFLGLIGACFVVARRCRSAGERGWAIYSAVTGVAFLAGLVGIASGSPSPVLNVAFGVAVIVGWAWISLLCAHPGSDHRLSANQFIGRRMTCLNNRSSKEAADG
jgi:hypothetical protein